MRRELGIYIHIPFCIKKCAYCDFFSLGGRSRDEHRAYIEVLLREIAVKSAVYAKDYIVSSVFFGGGTPSCIDAELLAGVAKALRDGFCFSEDCEITTEVNPGTIDASKLESYISAGINRLSMGVQTTSEPLLAVLGRIHSKQDFLTAYAAARAAGFKNINLDLIFAIPGQSLREWEDCLNEVISLKPEHISFYSLQIEEETEIFDKCRAGELIRVDEETDRLMYRRAVEILRANAYSRYEISNACREGFECRHNLKYWSMKDYLGLGAGAHSFMNGSRISGTDDINAYLIANRIGEYESERHVNTEHDRISEMMFLGLRRADGVSSREFKAVTGRNMRELFGTQIEKLAEAGLVEVTAEAGQIDMATETRRIEAATEAARIEAADEAGGTYGAECLQDFKIRLSADGIDISNTVFLEFI
jgi:oxygen-independent coproporphyrinogen-3 oxidase